MTKDDHHNYTDIQWDCYDRLDKHDRDASEQAEVA